LEDFAKVVTTSDLSLSELMLVEVEDERMPLANVGGQYYGVTDDYTHTGCPLSDGQLEGELLECPCHGSEFKVTTGKAISPPANKPLTPCGVRIEGNDILVGPSD
jgi:3-phenylpropionate/trans-cinnamate dioxygenase ferredoxin subunit/naphthalene 1,2-dioxygenase system ferredoxin subunit